jgi:hypothetical protein
MQSSARTFSSSSNNGSFYLAAIFELFVTSSPSNLLIYGTFAKMYSLYPGHDVHGFPVKYSSLKFSQVDKLSIDSAKSSRSIKFNVKSSFLLELKK